MWSRLGIAQAGRFLQLNNEFPQMWFRLFTSSASKLFFPMSE